MAGRSRIDFETDLMLRFALVRAAEVVVPPHGLKKQKIGSGKQLRGGGRVNYIAVQCPITGTTQMIKLIFAAAMLASASTVAMADAPWILHSEHSDLTCEIPQYSLADMFRMVSEYSVAVGLPQPQVDYTSAAKNGGTILHYTDPNTRNPGMIVFFASRALCERMRAAGEAWIGAGKPALK